MKKKKVMLFGTFDILHPGHEYVFSQAKNYGDCVMVVLARDVTVKKVK
ncbi:adenylyltransferase/cytidyltransferase family protein [Patescibacteria group bacterium]|nr:adenylyltransferase/cytidyltransferase family protein [Patescibacteria group bacterium]MBU1758382.1 adenylyltransferase/cytidyltransferase family protein [Patescibacteria group bacterium]